MKSMAERDRVIWSGLYFFVIAAFGPLYPTSLLHADGEPSISKYCVPDIVEAGQPVTVTIRVEGYSGEVSEPIPFDGVLVIDQSGSMGQNDPNDLRIDAAESFVDCVAGTTRLGVVSFSDVAVTNQGLTSNKPALHNALDQLRGNEGGGTNMYNAMQLAQGILTGGAAPDRERFIILLTDGDDTTGHSDADFALLAGNAASNDIIYHTIALGSGANFALLYMIADLTGGHSYLSATAADLVGLYTQICATTSQQARTREIILNEYVQTSSPTPVHVVPGSFSSSVTSLTAWQIQQFEVNGLISVPIGALGTGEEATITFQVTSDCLTPDSEPGSQVEVMVDESTSHVSYIYGLSQGTKSVPQESFDCVAPGDIKVWKTFDPNTLQLTIGVENKWSPDPSGVRDNSLRNIVVAETPSEYFQPELLTSIPQASDYVPGVTADVIVWKIPLLAPKEIRKLRVDLSDRVCSENYSPPIPVNAEKIPGGGEQTIAVYNDPGGNRERYYIPQITTTLPLPEQCDGRHDLYIEPARVFDDLQRELVLQWPLEPLEPLPRHIQHSDDSGGIWVDSEAGNGLWDGTSLNVSDYIAGARYALDVPGQGDLFHNAVRNVVYVLIINSGTQTSPALTNGLRLSVFHPATQQWNHLASVDIDALGPFGFTAVPVTLSPNSLTAEHIAPYRLNLQDSLALVNELEPSSGHVLKEYLRDNPSVRQNLIAQGPLIPHDVLAVLPSNLHDIFNGFLNRHPNLAWGKPSVRLRASAAVSAPEKHTTNNAGTEVVILDQ